MREAVSKSMTSLMACISPICMHLAMTLLTCCLRRAASSAMVISSGMETFSWALRAFSSWMRCIRSASVSRLPFWNCWRWRWVRWLNFCLLPWGVGLRRFSVFLVEARSSYRTSKRSTFTSTVRVSTVTWLLSRLTCTASAAAALVPVSRASSLKDTVFSSRFLWGWFWFLRLLFWPGALLALALALVLGLGLAGAAVAAVLAGGGVAALGVRLGLAVLAVAVLAAACAVLAALLALGGGGGLGLGLGAVQESGQVGLAVVPGSGGPAGRSAPFLPERSCSFYP